MGPGSFRSTSCREGGVDDVKDSKGGTSITRGLREDVCNRELCDGQGHASGEARLEIEGLKELSEEAVLNVRPRVTGIA